MKKMIHDSIQKSRMKLEMTGKERDERLRFPEKVTVFQNVSYQKTNPPALPMDIYRPAGNRKILPVVINVHGGGLVMGNKEFNWFFCAELCQLGFLVFAVEYQLVPEVQVYQQFADVNSALDVVSNLIPLYGGDSNHLYMVGDSAGAYLAIYTAAMQRSSVLAETAGVKTGGLPIKALGLISGMFYTRKIDSIGLFLPKLLYGRDYKKHPFLPYINPEHPEIVKNLPPSYLITSRNDHLRRYTTDFAKALKKQKVPYQLADYPANKKLTHAFSVFEPQMEESREAIKEMADFLLKY